MIKIKGKADIFAIETKNGEQNYTIGLNDTCAETAKQVLDSAGIVTPNGEGYIKGRGINTRGHIPEYEIPYIKVKTPSVDLGPKFVNPYSWYTQIKGGSIEQIYQFKDSPYTLITLRSSYDNPNRVKLFKHLQENPNEIDEFYLIRIEKNSKIPKVTTGKARY